MRKKLKSIEQVEAIAKRLRDEGHTIVTTNGSFDIMHSAHVNLLEKAKQEGDVLIVLLNSDFSIKKNKGDKRPIIPEDERARMLCALSPVDYVVIFSEDKPLNCLARIRPHVNVRGGSYIPDRMSEEKDFIGSWGGQYMCFELEKGFSTTELIEKILKNYTDDSISTAVAQTPIVSSAVHQEK